MNQLIKKSYHMVLACLLLMLALSGLHGVEAQNWTNTGSFAKPTGPLEGLNIARFGHTATLLSNGKVLVAGGRNNTSYFSSCELYDPNSRTWSMTGSLSTARVGHTATLLSNGKVLVAGGDSSGNSYLSSCELYDPNTGTWSSTGSLSTARTSSTAILLPDGKVLVVSGFNNTSYLSSCELYDPNSGTWSMTGSLSTGRGYLKTTLLSSGKVLVTGGFNGNTLTICELYDPNTGTWSSTGNLSAKRYSHTATLLSNGKVLVAGGSSGNGYLPSCELYDPNTGTWSTTGSLNTGRDEHTANLLSNGKVLVTGGYNNNALTSCELYDPNAGTWSNTGSLSMGRYYHTATLLSDGKVLATGGSGNPAYLSSCELYDPNSGAWLLSAPPPARYGHTATLFPNGKVLVTGGQGSSGVLTSCELYNPNTGTWSNTGNLSTARYYHTATLLLSGKVLVTGGFGNSGNLSSCELYDPNTGTWSNTGNLSTARYRHTATLLPNGKVLVAGGSGNSGNLSSCALYDPNSGTWSATGSLSTARASHTATLLSNGKVLVAGGYDGSCELYDSTTGTWSSTGNLNTGRSTHTATLLPSGKVLVAGGYNGSYLSSCELYDPTSGTWSATGSLSTVRYQHTATLLPNGKVLVAGGYNGSYLSSCELYDPTSGTWSATGSLNAARGSLAATLLYNGKVLATGGANGSAGLLASNELYTPAASNLSLNDVTANEGNTGTTTFTFAVTRSGDTSGTASVNYATSNGTAMAGSDYASASGTLNFAANDSTASFTVSVNGDTTIEADETFTVTLSNAFGATIADGSGLGTITNDDFETPSLIVTTTNDVSANDGVTSLREAIAYANSDSVDSAITFDTTVFATKKTITLSSDLPFISGNLNITGPTAGVEVSSNAATVFAMCTLQSGTVTLDGLTLKATASDAFCIANSGATATVRNCTINSSAVALYAISGSTSVENCTLTGIQGIINNSTVTVQNSTLVSSGNGSVGLDNNSTATVTNCTITGGTNGIYNNGGRTVNLSNSLVVGNTTNIEGDTAGINDQGHNITSGTAAEAGLDTGLKDNGGPTQTIALLAGSAAINAGNSALSTDQRGVARPQGSASDIGAYEVDKLLSVSIAPTFSAIFAENAGVGATTVRITRTGNLSSALNIDLRSSDTTEATIQSSATILAGDSYVDVPVNATDDTIVDGTQSVLIKATATGYIPEKVTLSVTDNEVVQTALSLRLLPSAFSEAKTGTAATLVVKHNRTSTATAVYVNLSSSDTRLNLPNSVQIPEGKRSVEVAITVTADSILTGTKSATVTADATNFTAANTTATIYDAQARITLSLAPSQSNTISEGATNNQTTLRVTRNTPTTGALVVNLSLNKGAGQVSYPSSVTIADGAAYADFVVSSVDDSAVDGTQSVVVKAEAAGYGSSTAQLYVKDNDGTAAMSAFKAPNEPSK